ncbi:hypothetical protein QR680_017363 [Steinernema hermaphroditum]|uniref:Cdc23 domain-containing protein n=1 Tax=Steinernema hermaphroditum TaxID=289476 RepID=A0AA39HGA3_9BILA|nr:hypothetical protein QR680_017363 [Steinernema hermaphroditum]
MTGRRTVSGTGGLRRAPSLQDRLLNSPRQCSTATPFKTLPKHPIDVTPGPSTQHALRADSFDTPGGKFADGIEETSQRLVDEYLKNSQHKTAIFWARKRLTIKEARNNNTPVADKAEYLRTLCACKDWGRIIAFVECHKLYREHLIFVYFYFSGLYNLKRFQDVLSFRFGHMIEFPGIPATTTESDQHVFWSRIDQQSEEDKIKLDAIQKDINLVPSLLVVLGKTYVIMQNRKAAGSCYRICLEYDILNVEAAQELIRHKLQTPAEILDILNRGVEHRSLSPAESQLFEMVKLLVAEVNLNEEQNYPDSEIKEAFYKCPTTRATAACELFRRGEVERAYHITYELMKEEGPVGLGLLVHIGTLVQLKKKEELYTLSHRLIEMNPEDEVAWYAVGCYFHIVEDRRDAKTYLDKCTGMNPSFGEAWIMFGHILTSESEHEHALNCYQRAARLLEHAFEPQLYIGLEHSYANNVTVATGHLQVAASISASHPIVIQEQAVLMYNQERYAEAYDLLVQALCTVTGWEEEGLNLRQLLSYNYDTFWEPLIQNLGHVARRMGKYDEAIACHKKSLLMCPKNVEALSALSLCYGSQSEIQEAMHYILKQCLDEYMTESQDLDKILYSKVDRSDELDMTTVDEMLRQMRAEMESVSIKKPVNLSREGTSRAPEKRDAPRRRSSQRTSTSRQYNTRSHARAAASNDLDEMET